MKIDWSKLAPHKPLDVADPRYVKSPRDFAEKTAGWIRAGGNTVLVAGPVGVGKSTELARLAALLQSDRFVGLVQMDRFENMHRLTPDQALLRTAGRLAYVAIQNERIALPAGLCKALVDRGVLAPALLDDSSVPAFEASPKGLLNAVLREVKNHSRHDRICLIFDGLEKLPEGPDARDIFEALGAIDENVDLVAVLPWHAAYGPRAGDILRGTSDVHAILAHEVEGPEKDEGIGFMADILEERITDGGEGTKKAPTPARKRLQGELGANERLVREAARWSGGVPRTFLQLMATAGTMGRFRRESKWPNDDDLTDALEAQLESVDRTLDKGDRELLQDANGRLVSEIELNARVRFMASGYLLEKKSPAGTVVRLHPMIAELLRRGSHG